MQETGPAPGDASNAKFLTQGISSVISALGAGSSATIDKLADIAAAITASIIGGTTGSNANRLLRSKGTSGRALQPSTAVLDDTGNLSGIADLTTTGNFTTVDINCDDITADDISAQDGAFSATLTKGGVSAAIVNQSTMGAWTFAFPENGNQWLIINSEFTFTITRTSVITLAGTATVGFFINGVTPLGGGANSASTIPSTVNHLSSNVVSATSALLVQFSSVSSSCAGLNITLAATRVLS